VDDSGRSLEALAGPLERHLEKGSLFILGNYWQKLVRQRQPQDATPFQIYYLKSKMNSVGVGGVRGTQRIITLCRVA
jgi:hypothetical protein